MTLPIEEECKKTSFQFCVIYSEYQLQHLCVYTIYRITYIQYPTSVLQIEGWWRELYICEVEGTPAPSYILFLAIENFEESYSSCCDTGIQKSCDTNTCLRNILLPYFRLLVTKQHYVSNLQLVLHNVLCWIHHDYWGFQVVIWLGFQCCYLWIIPF